MTNHTPGPWVIRKTDGGLYVERLPGDGIRSIVAILKSTHLCEEHGGSIEANARLIAAAPELLAALATLVDHAQEVYPHFESARGQRDIQAALGIIAKATGQ